MNTTTLCTILFAILLILFATTAASSDAHTAERLLNEHSKNAEKAIPATKQLFNYFWDKGEIPQDFNKRETEHLEDVKRVLRGIQISFVFLLALFIILIQYSKYSQVLLNGGLSAIATIAIVSIIPFTNIFEAMHQTLFPKGNWAFPAQSVIIQYYQESYFLSYAKVIAVIITALATFSSLAGIVLRKG